MSEEKRRFSRIEFTVATELAIDALSFRSDRVENLSVGGCLFPLSRRFTAGTACTVVLSLNDGGGPEVRIAGVVVRCDQDRVAIKFTGIDPDSLHHLHNILLYNAADPDKIEKEIRDRPGLV